jgi:hypothetical protein
LLIGPFEARPLITVAAADGVCTAGALSPPQPDSANAARYNTGPIKLFILMVFSFNDFVEAPIFRNVY